MESKQLRPGLVLGRYQLLLPIAKGGMGQVWAARLTGTRGFQKLVAVKTILAADEDAGELEEMLFEEASLASQVRHPNVAQTLDLGEQDGTLYLVMEWVDGEPLDSIMRAARELHGVPIAIAVHLIVQGCKGLHAAHTATSSKGEPLGIVHRDISPQNLLVTYSGVVKLVDFGVAKATHKSTQPTALGQVKGKFAYMAPEQVHGHPLDARADVFAMGIVLYRLTTGNHPFKSDNPAATIRNILTVEPTPPTEIVPNYPKTLEEVVLKALAKDKDARFASAHEMMIALERALPAPVSAHADKNTELFLHRLYEKRIVERNEALQAALKAADRESGTLPAARASIRFPRSQTTMRAVAVDSSSAPSASATEEPSVEAPIERPRRARWWALALAAGVAIGGGFAARQQISEARLRHRDARVAVAAQPVDAPSAISAPASLTPIVDPSAATASSVQLPDAATPATSASAGMLATPTKKRDRTHRDSQPAGTETSAVPAAPARAAPTVETSPAEVDPLNRRK